METFLLFKLPINSNFGSAIEQMAKKVKNKPAFHSLRKLAEIEGHGEDLSAITQPATLSIEEAHPAAQELMSLIQDIDEDHATEMEALCKDQTDWDYLRTITRRFAQAHQGDALPPLRHHRSPMNWQASDGGSEGMQSPAKYDRCLHAQPHEA